MTKEERKVLRDRVTASPEAWSEFIDKMAWEEAEEKCPGVHDRLQLLYLKRDRIIDEINELHETIGHRSSGPISGSPYARAYMILYDLPNMHVANKVMLHCMYPDQFPALPGYEKEKLNER